MNDQKNEHIENILNSLGKMRKEGNKINEEVLLLLTATSKHKNDKIRNSVIDAFQDLCTERNRIDRQAQVFLDILIELRNFETNKVLSMDHESRSK